MQKKLEQASTWALVSELYSRFELPLLYAVVVGTWVYVLVTSI